MVGGLASFQLDGVQLSCPATRIAYSCPLMDPLDDFLKRRSSLSRDEMIRELEQKSDDLELAARRKARKSRRDFLDSGGTADVERVGRFLSLLKYNQVPTGMSDEDAALCQALMQRSTKPSS